MELEKDKEIGRLNELCHKFDFKRVKNKIIKNIETCLDEFEMQSKEFEDKEGVFCRFLEKLLQDHQKNIEKDPQDVYLLALEIYKRHLKELEARDISTLKKQIRDLGSIKRDLLNDLENE